MIKVRNIETWGFKHAIRGMRNSYNSWDKSDTLWCDDWDCDKQHICPNRTKNGCCGSPGNCVIGERDLERMHKLYVAGPEHRKYMRQIFVSMDITAPLYWWKEFDTYKVGTTANSCSTMHKIADKEFTLDDFSHEHLFTQCEKTLQVLIDELNRQRNNYLVNKSKDCWWQMIQLLPSSYNQKRTVTMNYENVVTIINQRAGHRLNEWKYFTVMLFDLPYVKEIIGNDEDVYDD